MFQTGFLWMLLAAGVYGLLHSWLASHTLKSWVEARLGDSARRFYRLGYVLVSVFALLPLALLGRLLPDRSLYSIPFPWILLTFGLQAASAFGLLVAVSQTGTLSFLGLRQISQPEALAPGPAPAAKQVAVLIPVPAILPPPATRQVAALGPVPAILPPPATRLVTNGLYRLVRHPIYSLSLLALWCIPLVSWNTLALMLGLSTYLLVGALFEERKLVAEYGDEYRSYRRRTPMLFPRIL